MTWKYVGLIYLLKDWYKYKTTIQDTRLLDGRDSNPRPPEYGATASAAKFGYEVSQFGRPQRRKQLKCHMHGLMLHLGQNVYCRCVEIITNFERSQRRNGKFEQQTMERTYDGLVYFI
jgi:hypothetical protein